MLGVGSVWNPGINLVNYGTHTDYRAQFGITQLQVFNVHEYKKDNVNIAPWIQKFSPFPEIKGTKVTYECNINNITFINNVVPLQCNANQSQTFVDFITGNAQK